MKDSRLDELLPALKHVVALSERLDDEFIPIMNANTRQMNGNTEAIESLIQRVEADHKLLLLVSEQADNLSDICTLLREQLESLEQRVKIAFQAVAAQMKEQNP